jgi:oxygen-independent coproporphyrinogen-3 oxidase
MGYTTRAGTQLLGFGPSAISELATSYAQSHRELAGWQAEAAAGRLATLRGHALGEDDLARRWVIGEIMCQGAVRASEWRARFGGEFAERFAGELRALEPLAGDGLLDVAADGSLEVSALGRLLVRNVAAAFDAYLPDQRLAAAARFSQTV